jgi:hypothetical protein
MTLLVAGCGATGGPGSTASDEGPGPGGGSQQPPEPVSSTEELPSTPVDGEAIVLHGSFVGLRRDTLVTADLTVEFDLHWNAGPDDVHDINAFALDSGSFEFSESIDGVCGGSRSESGELTSHSDPTGLQSAELQERDIVMLSVIDQRIETGAVAFSVSGSYDVPNPDPEGCGDLDRGGVGVCALEFQWLGVGQLASEATCSGNAGDWTGTLAP